MAKKSLYDAGTLARKQPRSPGERVNDLRNEIYTELEALRAENRELKSKLNKTRWTTRREVVRWHEEQLKIARESFRSWFVRDVGIRAHTEAIKHFKSLSDKEIER